MGQCRYCVFFNEKYWDSNDDNVHNWCTFLNQRVSPSASCNNYSEKPTASNSGYTGGSGCFLTSACVEYLGKPDDCEELTVLRAFRDGYMSLTEERSELVKDYYSVAPRIVDKINLSENKAKYYDYIYQTILKCLEFIDLDKNEKALDCYKNMVFYLKKQLQL